VMLTSASLYQNMTPCRKLALLSLNAVILKPALLNMLDGDKD